MPYQQGGLLSETEAAHLAVARVALGHHGGRLEGGVGDLGHRQLLVVGLLRGDDRGVGGEHEVDARVGHQVGLELGHVHVEGAVEAQGRRQRGDDLGNQPARMHASACEHKDYRQYGTMFYTKFDLWFCFACT